MVLVSRVTDSNLTLTGYIEPNKPRIGRAVAAALGMPFVDVEERIEERMGGRMSDLLESFGERRLKTMQAEVMDEMVLRRRTVLRVNGSMLVHDKHYEKLRATGPVVCLIARLDAILQRMHLTLGARFHDPRERGVELGHLRREWAVRRKDDLYELDVTDYDDDGTVKAIVAVWEDLGLVRG